MVLPSVAACEQSNLTEDPIKQTTVRWSAEAVGCDPTELTVVKASNDANQGKDLHPPQRGGWGSVPGFVSLFEALMTVSSRWSQPQANPYADRPISSTTHLGGAAEAFGHDQRI